MKLAIRRLFIPTLLWTLVVISLSFVGLGFFGIGIVSLYGTIKLSKWCRKRFDLSLLPHKYTERLGQLEIFQIFFIRSKNRKDTAVLYFLGLVSFAASLALFISSLSPALDLDQMDKRTGVVERVIKKPKFGAMRSCGDRLYVRNLNSESIDVYYGRFFEILKNSIGSELIIWSQVEYGFPPCIKKDKVWQIEKNGEIIKYYNKQRAEWVDRLAIKMLYITCSIFLISIFVIWKVHNKKR